ncbi:TetR/AcrR family transcriptional regulator [Methylocapsa acidiphila]|uniref:TetR/AcrR family transcriptional regulator n=1 Tax=Methylocapsa acidiphila TaxID=133552 RepID=UPI0018DD5824|nr:TetR/AcrR family transcriptional regulator [Methylocapsa acidiphila]
MSTFLKEYVCRRVPRGEKRRDEIAAVAERIFIERGYSETTMQMIAAEAGASKETLYRHFGSKDALMAEIMRNCAAQILGEVDGELPAERPARETLLSVGRNLLQCLFGQNSLSMLRIVLREGARSPGLGELFYAQGPEHVSAQLAGYLAAATRRGELSCPDAELAARLFLGAVVANRVIQELVAPGRDDFCEAKIEAHVEEAVSLFLSRYGCAGPSSKA